MEFLLLLLLPLLGSVLGDSAAEDDADTAADDPADARQAAAHESDEPTDDSTEDEDMAAKAAPDEDQPDLPGGDGPGDDGADDATTTQIAQIATVPDFDGSAETLTLQVEKGLFEGTTRADLTAETDTESGNITLALAGQDIAVLTDPRGFDLAKVSLEAA